MATALQGKRIAILTADGVERVELDRPRDAVQQASGHTVPVSPQTCVPQACNNDLAAAAMFTVDRAASDAAVDDYDTSLLRFRKPVGAICHGAWTLVEAGVAKGRTLTSCPSLRADLRNAGADVVDEEVVIYGNLASSRSPDDLSAFCQAVVEQFAKTGAGAS
ncbi:DJ-1/PfpI family protein [Nocardia abscessus]|uniref:DJ-1/PfpI family protein n=1 Tax=Nocardia TaxID=1817 RepID=UPI00189481AC|nr:MULTISPECIES: DJ-1/PfpI family protein [Nocardia]MBF6223108.1 DJ-1/PfpI family protein [Nocardia abscessus]MDE1674599.1 DJ-1/PfpI family protein [Nocardia gipuzkoensis]